MVWALKRGERIRCVIGTFTGVGEGEGKEGWGGCGCCVGKLRGRFFAVRLKCCGEEIEWVDGRGGVVVVIEAM